MLPLLLCVCLLPFFATTALLVARHVFAIVRTRYAPKPAIPRVLAALLGVARPSDDVETPSDVSLDASDDAPAPATKQPLEYLLAFDVEATCVQGTGFDWPNEIIEWPVVLLKWTDRDADGRARTLEVVDEFRSYVKPVWRPILSDFCISLTGISQANIDCAPQFKTLLRRFQAFLAKHGLVDPRTGKPIKRFAFCTDGPFDVRDFCVKTAYINKLPMPEWLRQDVVDVRRVVAGYLSSTDSGKKYISRMHSLNMVAQLHAFGLQFEGRQHCGMDDARNVARILVELGKREVRLEPNTAIHPRKRWPWMARDGQVHFDEATYLNGRPFHPAPVTTTSSSPPPSLTSSAASVQSSSVHTSRSTSPQRLSPYAPTYQYNPDLASRIKDGATVWQAPASWRKWKEEDPVQEQQDEVVEAPARMESQPNAHYSPLQNKPWLGAGHSRSRSSPANMTSLPQSLWSPVVVTGPIAIVPPPAPQQAAA